MPPEDVAILFRNCVNYAAKKHPKFGVAAEQKITEIAEYWEQTLDNLDPGIDRDRPEFGVLRAIGYGVGNQGVEQDIRRWLIDYAMIGVLPPIKNKLYMSEWGEPECAKRFFKLSRVIQFLIEDHAHPTFEKARRDWRKDLDYLDERWGHLSS